MDDDGDKLGEKLCVGGANHRRAPVGKTGMTRCETYARGPRSPLALLVFLQSIVTLLDD